LVVRGFGAGQAVEKSGVAGNYQDRRRAEGNAIGKAIALVRDAFDEITSGTNFETRWELKRFNTQTLFI